MNSYYDQIKEVLPDITESELGLPWQEGNIDSIDRVCIRAILEKRVGELPDSVWNRFDTVQAAIDYCQQREEEARCGLKAGVRDQHAADGLRLPVGALVV